MTPRASHQKITHEKKPCFGRTQPALVEKIFSVRTSVELRARLDMNMQGTSEAQCQDNLDSECIWLGYGNRQ
jgi:hypothetical protein